MKIQFKVSKHYRKIIFQAVKYRNYIFLFLLLVIFIVLSIVYRKAYYQLYRDRRCFYEIRNKHHPSVIQSGSKEGKSNLHIKKLFSYLFLEIVMFILKQCDSFVYGQKLEFLLFQQAC